MVPASMTDPGQHAAVAIATRNGHDIANMSVQLRSNRSVVLAAVHQNGRALRHATALLRADLGVVCASLRQIRGAGGVGVPEFLGFGLLRGLPEGRKADAAYMTALVKVTGWALQHAAPPLQDNEAIVHAAVSTDGLAIKHASERLRGAASVVVAAVVAAGDTTGILGTDVLAHAAGALGLLPCLRTLAAVTGRKARLLMSRGGDFRRRLSVEQEVTALRLPTTPLGAPAMHAFAAAVLKRTAFGYNAPLVVFAGDGNYVCTVGTGWWREGLRAAVQAACPHLAASPFSLTTPGGWAATTAAVLATGYNSPRVVFLHADEHACF